MTIFPKKVDPNGRWFGKWNLRKDDGFPVVQDLIDTDWQPSDLDQLTEYLTNCPLLVALGSATYCYICQHCALLGGWRSDGAWLWTASLHHYLREHSVKPPDAMLAHIRTSNYRIVDSSEIDVDSLDWPVSRPG